MRTSASQFLLSVELIIVYIVCTLSHPLIPKGLQYLTVSAVTLLARPTLTYKTNDQCVPYALAFLYPIVVCIIALFIALVAFFFSLYYNNYYGILFVLEIKPATISCNETCGQNLLAGI
jgi:hypothetical protein